MKINILLLVLVLLTILGFSVVNALRYVDACTLIILQGEKIEEQAEIIRKLEEFIDEQLEPIPITYEVKLVGDVDIDTNELIDELVHGMKSHQYYIEHPDHSPFNLSGFQTIEEFVEWNAHCVEVYEQAIYLLTK